MSGIWTPAPWHVHPDAIKYGGKAYGIPFAADDVLIQSARGESVVWSRAIGTASSTLADAQLIALAPELADAMIELHDAHIKWEQYRESERHDALAIRMDAALDNHERLVDQLRQIGDDQ